jgi:hypothetical protein
MKTNTKDVSQVVIPEMKLSITKKSTDKEVAETLQRFIGQRYQADRNILIALHARRGQGND